MTAMTLHGRDSKMPLIESQLGESHHVICINVSGCTRCSSLTNCRTGGLLMRCTCRGCNRFHSDDPKNFCIQRKIATSDRVPRPLSIAASFPWKQTYCLIYVDQMCCCEIKAATDYALWPFCPGTF